MSLEVAPSNIKDRVLREIGERFLEQQDGKLTVKVDLPGSSAGGEGVLWIVDATVIAGMEQALAAYLEQASASSDLAEARRARLANLAARVASSLGGGLSSRLKISISEMGEGRISGQ